MALRLLEGAKVALRSIAANKLRSALTALGIVIGVAAVIALVSIGQGAAADVTARFESMGSHLIIVSPQRNTQLSVGDAADLEERVPSIECAVPVLTFSAPAKAGIRAHDTAVEGTGARYPEVRGFQLAAGRFFTAGEVEQRARVAVLGPTVVGEVFDGQNPLGQIVYLRGQPFTVVGVTAPRGTAMGRDADDVVYIPVTSAQRLAGTARVGSIYVKARSAGDAALAVTHITAIFERKFLRPDAVRVSSQDELLAVVGDTARTFTVLLGAIAGISLLVGGIGIMNIMLVSVTERTREIGVRKALGAKRRDILAQFLIESMLLSAAGGMLGIGLGAGLSRFVARAGGWPTLVSPEAVLIAFGFAAATGLFFGVYPARRASELDPVEALRYE